MNVAAGLLVAPVGATAVALPPGKGALEVVAGVVGLVSGGAVAEGEVGPPGALGRVTPTVAQRDWANEKVSARCQPGQTAHKEKA